MMGKFRKNTFLNQSIRVKLLICFCLLIIIPVSFVAWYCYGVSHDIIEEKTDRYSHDILFQTTQNLTNRVEKIEDISFNIFINPDIQSMLLSAAERQLSDYEASRYTTQIESILAAQTLYHDEVNAIYIISSAGYTYELDKTKQNYTLPDNATQLMDEAAGAAIWFGGLEDPRVVALARTINSVQNQKPVGYLVMYISTDYFYQVLADTKSVMGGEIYTADATGKIVISDDRELTGTFSPHYSVGSQTADYSFTIQELAGTKLYVAMSKEMDNGWRTVLAVPVSDYLKEIHYLRTTVALLTFAALFAAVMIAQWMAKSISRPILKLTKTMKQFGDGDLSVRCHPKAKDEIGQCMVAFSDMADHINHLINQVYEEELMKQQAELKSLQMQINPHFLYNTLETINWMARSRGNEDVGMVVKSLGDLMRATIGGKDLVTLAEEKVNLQNYLSIQQCRYADKFESEILIPEELEKCLIPKLIIQPLVENAIYHGIAPSYGQGKLSIRARREDGDLVLEVHDDGVGMTEEAIAEVLDISDSRLAEHPHSIGICNVIKRIKKLYGDAYGITIESEIGEGTIITMRIPLTQQI